MSLDARGKFAGALVFSSWKGRPVVRQLVTPANPQSADQQAARNAVRVFGAIQNFVNRMSASFPAKRRAGASAADKDLLITAAPAGYAWNGNLMKVGIGAQQVNYLAAIAAYDGGANATPWNAAAAALDIPILAVPQVTTGGVPDDPLEAGKVYYIYCYALFMLGIGAEPTTTPPTWA